MAKADAVESREGNEQGNPARELVGILLRGKWTILIVFLLVTGAAALAALRTPPMFAAESSLMVRIGREYIYRPEVGRTETARTPSLSEMVNSEVEILSSRDLAEQVVRELGVEVLYPEILELVPDAARATEIAVPRFRQAASVRPVLESSVIKVGFEHPVPQIAADAVNLLVDRFKDKHIEVFGEERSGGLEDQLAARQRELARAEEALAQFKRENGVIDLAQQRNLLLSRRVRLEEELHACELQLVALRISTPQNGEPEAAPELPGHLAPDMKGELLRQRHELERELRSLEPSAPDRLIESASLRLLELELEESQLLRDFNEGNRRVQSVRGEIERVRSFLAEAEHRAGTYEEYRRRERETHARGLETEIARIAGDIELLVRADAHRLLVEACAKLQALEVQRDDYVRRLEVLDQDIRAMDQHEKVLRQLERSLGAAEAGVATYEQRVDEARITEELDREKRINVRVIEKAAAPVAPSGLSPELKLAIGAFVGLVAGVGAAVLLDLFRPR